MSWVPFWFEGNLWFGEVDCESKWAELLDAYDGKVTNARECIRSESWPDMIPKFGFAIECDGKRTLGDFMWENRMGVFVPKKEKQKTGSSV